MRQIKITQSATVRDELSISDYLADLNQIPQITPEEEVELAQKIHEGGPDAQKALDRLVLGNLRFVVSVAKQYQGMGMLLGDIINEGNIGLIKAAQRFDEKRGFKFISYAVWWIRQSIIQAISDKGRAVRLPQNNINMLNKYWKMCDEFMQKIQRKPTIEEFAAACGIDVEKATDVIQAASQITSIDAPIGDEKDSDTASIMPSDIRTDSHIDRESLECDLLDVMKKVLKEKECEILCKSFGIAWPQMSLEELSANEGLSKERLRQIRERSISKLRDSNGINILRPYLG